MLISINDPRVVAVAATIFIVGLFSGGWIAESVQNDPVIKAANERLRRTDEFTLITQLTLECRTANKDPKSCEFLSKRMQELAR